MKKIRLWFRIGLFSLILVLGTGTALIVGETTGLALSDLSTAQVRALSRPAQPNSSLYTVLVGQSGGIYRSRNAGWSWQRTGTVPAETVTALAVHPSRPQTLYAGTVGGRSVAGSLWYSQSGGRSWDATSLTLPTNRAGQYPTVSAMAVAPDQPNLLYVGTEGQGLYRFQVQQGLYDRIGGNSLASLYVRELVVSPNNRLYAVTPEGVLVINGLAVQVLDTLPDVAISLAVDPANPKLLYAGTAAYGAFRSKDGGQSWESINTNLGWQPGLILRVPAIAVDPADPRHVALATAYGVGSHIAPDRIYESVDGGQTWQRLADSESLVKRLTIEGGTVYAVTEQGLRPYGQTLPTDDPASRLRLQALAEPTGSQLLILALTIALAGLVLAGRLEWLVGWWQAQRLL